MGKAQSKRKTTTPEKEIAVTNLPFDIVLLVAKYHNWIPDGVVSHPIDLPSKMASVSETVDAKCTGFVLTMYRRYGNEKNWTNEIDLKHEQLAIHCSKHELWNSDEHHVIVDGHREWKLDRNRRVLYRHAGDWWTTSYDLSEYRSWAGWPEIIDGKWTCLFYKTDVQLVQVSVDGRRLDSNVLRRDFCVAYHLYGHDRCWSRRKDNVYCVFDDKDTFFIFCNGTLTRELSLSYTSSYSVVSFDIAKDGCIWVATTVIDYGKQHSVVKIDPTSRIYEYKIREDWVEFKRFICACDVNGGALVVGDNYIETISAFAQPVVSSLWTVQIHSI